VRTLSSAARAENARTPTRRAQRLEPCDSALGRDRLGTCTHLIAQTPKLPFDVSADNVRETAGAFRAFAPLKHQVPELVWAEVNASAYEYLGAVVTLIDLPTTDDAHSERDAARQAASEAAASAHHLRPEQLAWTLAARLTDFGSDNEPFSMDEQEEVQARLDEILLYLRKTPEVTAEQLAALQESVEYLKEAVGRLGRIDWRNALIGALVSAMIQAALPTPVVRVVIAMIRRTMGHLLGGEGTPELPGGDDTIV
jgi:hypothetical protein